METEKKYAKNVKCAVFHCGAKAEDGVSFSMMPKPDAGKDGIVDLLANLKARQRALWETALGKVIDLRCKNHLICSRHFIKGKKARIIESSDPDWVPTLNLEPHGASLPPERIIIQQSSINSIDGNNSKQTNRRMSNYEVYALIEGRVKYNHMFRNKANREHAWRFVQRNCSPLLNCFSIEQMEQKWIKLCRLYQRITGPRDSQVDPFPAEEWVHYSKMHDAMGQMKNPNRQEVEVDDDDGEVETEDDVCCEVDDYYNDGGDKILWGTGSFNKPQLSRPAKMATRPVPKRPITSGRRTCKAIQSGNPGLQPTARPIPPHGSPDYCRLCFTNDQLEPLCSGVIVVRDELLEKIYVCTGVLVIARPKESVYICSPCAALINNFSTFRQQICSNNRALLDHLRGQISAEVPYSEPMPPLVGSAVSSVLSQSHVVRGPTPKKIILAPANKTVPLKVRANTPMLVRAPQLLQKVGTPRLPTLTRAPNTPVIVKRIVYAKPVAPAPPTPIQPTDEAVIDLPEEIKTEFDDPLEGCGDSGNALVMPKPLKTTVAPPPPTTLKMRVESQPGPVVVDENEQWSCWHCEQSFVFKFECAKHLLQAHQERVGSIRDRLELDELNTNMLEMMALRGGGRKVVVVTPAAKRPRLDESEVVEIE